MSTNFATRIAALATRLAIDAQSWNQTAETPDDDALATLADAISDYTTLGTSPTVRAQADVQFRKVYAETMQTLKAGACPLCGAPVAHLAQGTVCCYPAHGHMPG